MEKWRSETIELLRNGEKTSCYGCSALRYGLYSKKPKILILGVGPNFAGGTKCNCNCFYCNQNSVIREQTNQVLSNYDIHKIAAEMYKDLENTILASGEPSIIPDVDKLFFLINEKGWSVNFNTNGIVYSDFIAESLAKNKQSFIAVALDSGTSETYKKVKRVDKFHTVVENLHKYKDKGCQIFLKYILCPGYNDNLNDISEFIKIVKSLDIKHVTLSQNLSGFVDGKRHEVDPNMSESMFALFAYMIARLQEEGIYWDFQIEFINKHDFERLEKLRK